MTIPEHVSLRQKAKEKLKKGNAAKDSSQTSGTKLPQSEDEYMKLLHEFQISQIELELQYEKLRQALDRVETATALYDFAPVGFFTLAADGLIDQLNATAASLLSDDRSSLKNSNFRQFISPVDHPVFDAFLQKIFGSNFRQSCEVRIILKRNPSLLVRLEGIISENEQKCVVSAVDITESKRAEETIKKSEANLISVLNNRDESIWSIDRNYNLIVFNNFFRDEYFASFNIELKQGMNVLNILSPKLREFWKPKYDKALSGRKLSFEYSNQVGNELHFYEVFLNPIKSNGKITGVSALSIVVTNQKQAEAALRFSESKYRKLLESMRDGFAYVNMIGVIRESNESFRRMLGYSSEELSHLTYNDITPEKWHDYENKILVEQIFARGYSEVYEKEYVKKDGTVFPVELSATLVKNELGKNEGIWAVVRDITERKLAEKELKEAEIKFRTIFNFASDGFLGAWVDSHKLSTANSKICEMLGYTEEELLTMTTNDVHPKESLPYVLDQFEKLARKEIKIAHNIPLLKKDGTVFFTDVSATPIILEGKDYLLGLFRDITERRRADEAVKESEQKLKAVVNGSPIPQFVIDQNHTVIHWNKAIETITGMKAENIIGTKQNWVDFYGEVRPSMADFLVDQNFDAISELYQGKYKKSKFIPDAYEATDFFPSFGKEGKWLHFTAAAIKDSVGNIMGAIETLEDITERKQIEEVLAHEKALIDAIFDSVPGIIYLYDMDGTLIRWNKMHMVLTGYTSEELAHFQLMDWYKGDVESQTAVAEGLKTTMQKGFGTAEANLQKKDGTIIPMYLTVALLTIDGKQYFTGIGLDITDRKQAEEALRQSEERLQKAQMIAHIGNWELDLKTNMMRASQEAIRIYGVDETVSELPLSTLQSLVLGDYRETLDQSLKELIAHKKEYKEEFQIRRANDGEIRFIFSIAEIVLAPDGTPQKVFGIMQDITERKQAEEALRQNEIRLHELNATKDKFFSIIAHDLKSPFNSILGFSELLVDQVQENNYEGIENYAKIIQKSSEQAMDLVTNLLEWSRTLTGRMEYNPEYVEIIDLINSVDDLLSPVAQNKSITILKKLPRSVPVYADKAMISTVLRNLVSNAIKFTNPGGQILILAEQKRNELKISVTDNGVGIKKEAIDKLFKIEESYSTIGTQNEKGTGLGLILCKEFVEKHGGKIWVESTLGQGSTFCFTIPRRHVTL
jgi:PAS domain S-box-containing protein